MARAMSEGQAVAALEVLLDVTSEPTLESDEVARLVAAARRTDAAGVAPGGDGWDPTFDINAAVRVGARLKARKCASDFTFSTDNQSYDRSAMHRHWSEIADGVKDIPRSIPVSVPWVGNPGVTDSWA